MKMLMIAALVLGFVSVTASAQNTAVLKTSIDSVSYSIGQEIAGGLKKQNIDVNSSALTQGIQDALSGKSAIAPEQMQACLTAFQQKLVARQQADAAQAGAANQKAGDAYLAENKKKKGVITLPSGLQYEVLKEGTGKTPKAEDEVTVDYVGTLVDGKVFDSSIERGQPATFKVGGVIPGWTEALQLMKVGSKWRLVIPPALAYGERGAGDAIGPNSVLIFEVTLLSVK